MKKANWAVVILSLLIPGLLWAAPAPKYVGDFEITPNKIHKEGAKGHLEVIYDGANLLKITMKTDKPLFNKTEFESTEQEALFAAGNPLQLALIFKLKGPPHKWYFVYVSASKDAGKIFTSTLYSAPGPIADIEKALNTGAPPATWKVQGPGTLTAVP